MSVETPLRLAIFDCDGTLVDSQHLIAKSMAEAFGLLGFPVPSLSDVRRVIGLPLQEAISRLLNGAEESDCRRIAEGYREAFHARRLSGDFAEPLFSGATEALRALEQRGVLLGVATGKGRRGLDAVLDHHGIRDCFVVLKTADDGPGKPRPDVLIDAMSETGVSPDDTAMIGDTVFDVKMAVSARVEAIGVSWGYHDTHELVEAGATTVVEDFSALPQLLFQRWGL